MAAAESVSLVVLVTEISGILGEAQCAVGSSSTWVEKDQSAAWCVLEAHCPLHQGMGLLMSVFRPFPAYLGRGIVPGWGGGFAEALQHGGALRRSRSGEATCLLGSLAGD